MNPKRRYELEELLTRDEAPEPPAGLAERIKAEIPTSLPAAGGGAPPSRGAASGVWPGTWWLAAASLAAMVGAGLLTQRVLDERSRPAAATSGRQVAVQEPAAAAGSEDEARLPSQGRLSPAAPEADSPGAAADRVPSMGDRVGAPPAPPAEMAASLEAVLSREAAGAPARDEAVQPPSEAGASVRPDPSSPSPRVQVTERKREAELGLDWVRQEAGGEARGRAEVEEPGADADAAGEVAKRLRMVQAPAAEEVITVTPPEPLSDRRAVTTAAPPDDLALAIPEGTEPVTGKSQRPPEAAEERARALVSRALEEKAEAEWGARPKARRLEELRPVPPPPPGSTGGTSEPNDAPYGDVFFRSYGVNPFVDTEEDRLSTFGLDVDTGSYTVIRRFLSDGHLPPPAAVRIEELVNAFRYGDAPPRRGEDFALYAEGAPTPFAPGERYRLLRFALRGRVVEAAERPPAVLTFVIDVSGSMARENRLGLVREALDLLLGELRPDDRVAVVVYGTRAHLLVGPTADRQAVRSALETLYPQGSTNAEEGLAVAYETARRAFRPGAINRVILCSDGVANVGRTSAGAILGRVAAAREGGIELTTVGFGMGNYNDVLLEQLADRGDGTYAYVDTLAEARRIFSAGLTGTLMTIARDAKVQVELNPAVVARWRLLGYENRDIADHRFRDDTVDAGEIGAGHGVTALYEVKLRPRVPRDEPLATLYLRYRSAATGQVKEVRRQLTARQLAPSWRQASPALRLASLVAEYGELLKGSYWAREGDPEEVFRRAQAVALEFPGDAEVADFASLAGRAARLLAARAADSEPRRREPPSEDEGGEPRGHR